MLRSVLVLLLSTSQISFGSSFPDKQLVLTPTPEFPNAPGEHVVDKAILAALKTHSDPVDALVSLQHESSTDLAQPRLLHVFGDQEPKWMTEGDKLRLHRRGKKFVDITDHEDFYTQQIEMMSGKASESLVSPVKVHLFTVLQISRT